MSGESPEPAHEAEAGSAAGPGRRSRTAWKPLALAGGGTLGVCLAAIFVVSAVGVPRRESPWDRLRGTEAYFTGDELNYEIPQVIANLVNEKVPRLLQLGITVVYRLGPEVPDGAALFKARNPQLQDRLLILLAAKSFAEIDRGAAKDLLKQEIIDLVEAVVFPDGKGRIERVLFRDYYVE